VPSTNQKPANFARTRARLPLVEREINGLSDLRHLVFEDFNREVNFATNFPQRHRSKSVLDGVSLLVKN
jgi:hypothetical protein